MKTFYKSWDLKPEMGHPWSSYTRRGEGGLGRWVWVGGGGGGAGRGQAAAYVPTFVSIQQIKLVLLRMCVEEGGGGEIGNTLRT